MQHTIAMQTAASVLRKIFPFQQMASLELENYAGFYVRGFLRRSWINIPLEAQAFQLEARFSMTPAEVFSVEEEINLWARDNRF